jgi:hypothetical protein
MRGYFSGLAAARRWISWCAFMRAGRGAALVVPRLPRPDQTIGDFSLGGLGPRVRKYAQGHPQRHFSRSSLKEGEEICAAKRLVLG